jgi:hypothetical protein
MQLQRLEQSSSLKNKQRDDRYSKNPKCFSEHTKKSHLHILLSIRIWAILWTGVGGLCRRKRNRRTLRRCAKVKANVLNPPCRRSGCPVNDSVGSRLSLAPLHETQALPPGCAQPRTTHSHFLNVRNPYLRRRFESCTFESACQLT